MKGQEGREGTKPVDDAVTRFKSGDREAFREIVMAHQGGVRVLIASYGIPAADVDDIAQDAFLHAYEHIGEFEPGTSLGAWLKAMARFKAMAHLEAAKRESRNRAGALRVFLQQRSQERSESGESGSVERLRECLDRLDERHRGMLEKRYAGVPLHQVAQEMARTVDAIKMILLRVRQQLRKCMEART